MLYLFLLCLVTGSKALTYNGVDTFTDVTISKQVTNTSLTFTLRTRQTEAVVLQTNSTNSMKFSVTIVDGKLVFTGNYGSGEVQLNDSKRSNDGMQHTVLLETATSKTSLYIDNEKRIEAPIDLLNTAWKTSVNNIVIGKGDGFIPFYQGCLNGLIVGGVTIDLENATSTGSVVTGCNSVIDSCSPSPCQNGGNCTDVFNEYSCNCTKYYAGRNCTLTKDIDCNFTTNLCNNGTCQTLATGKSRNHSEQGNDFFQCNCTTGYTGVLCQKNIDECAAKPCRNGTCTDLVGDYQCKCVAGYTGKNCDVNIDDCKPNPCKFNRNCTDGINNYTCDCGGVFKGINCETDVNECLENPNTCSMTGNCTNEVGGFTCTCEEGYFSKNCQHNNTEICEIQRPCKNGGTCSDNMSGYNCTCIGNYHGVNCESLSTDTDDDDNNLPLILGLVLAGVFIILMVIIICLVRYCRDKSGMEGTYSPNKEEQAGGNVEMHAIKKPKTERLI